MISFGEGVDLVRALLEAGYDPSTFMGSAGIFKSGIWEELDPDNPNVLDGMSTYNASQPHGYLDEEFLAWLDERDEGNFVWGPHTFDCVMILALAARAAGSTDGDAIIAQIGPVTNLGEECISYRETEGAPTGPPLSLCSSCVLRGLVRVPMRSRSAIAEAGEWAGSVASRLSPSPGRSACPDTAR